MCKVKGLQRSPGSHPQDTRPEENHGECAQSLCLQSAMLQPQGILQPQVHTDMHDENEQKIKVPLPQNDKRVSANGDVGRRCAHVAGHIKFIPQMGSDLIGRQTQAQVACERQIGFCLRMVQIHKHHFVAVVHVPIRTHRKLHLPCKRKRF